MSIKNPTYTSLKSFTCRDEFSHNANQLDLRINRRGRCQGAERERESRENRVENAHKLKCTHTHTHTHIHIHIPRHIHTHQQAIFIIAAWRGCQGKLGNIQQFNQADDLRLTPPCHLTLYPSSSPTPPKQLPASLPCKSLHGDHDHKTLTDTLGSRGTP